MRSEAKLWFPLAAKITKTPHSRRDTATYAAQLTAMTGTTTAKTANSKNAACRAAGLRARANTARRLANDVFDDTTQHGLIDFADDCDRQATVLEAQSSELA